MLFIYRENCCDTNYDNKRKKAKGWNKSSFDIVCEGSKKDWEEADAKEYNEEWNGRWDESSNKLFWEERERKNKKNC